ncbi:MAG: hypothetical protein EBQ92_07640 [Proteobacteria bacterium]|nr:hypothetical protein [Pseudomonadota bacterium]
MNHKVLLIDSGVTVQKIVALSLDKSKYSGLFVASKEDAKKQILEQKPGLVLVSDRAAGIEWQRFPKEVETWLGREGKMPAMVLLASGDIREAKHYQAVLQKPFTPQSLQDVLDGLVNKEKNAELSSNNLSNKLNSERFDQLFQDAEAEEITSTGMAVNLDLTSAEEQRPVTNAREQLENLWESPAAPVVAPETRPQTESVSDLWGGSSSSSIIESQNQTPRFPSDSEPQILRSEESLAYKSLLENQVQQKLESQNLNEMVEKVLARLLPPLVERLVQERLDQLLTEQEQDLDPNQNIRL